tara:strand:- start:21407 stop:22378 length:972 start_codon:yes stop_codon:yes gene_type:complete
MKLLIPGGAGYIGSHMVRYAQEHNHEVVVLDNFSTGNDWSIKDCEVIEANLVDQENLLKLLKGRKFDGVIHFAAKSLVGESLKEPSLYYQNNLVGSLNLIDVMIKNDINNLVFSSSAAIFGNPKMDKISESHIKNPINPYGKSKLMVENILEDLCLSTGLNALCLRYFNAAGAHKSGEIGESHEPETHLIPSILKAVLDNKTDLKVFGNDYNTHDGTCIRDYVHVEDLANAHLLGLENMKKLKGFSAFNLGNGSGFSVLDIIKECEKVTNTKISYQVEKKREGDPAILVADNKLANNELNWKPKYKKINEIIESAWMWHSRNQ